MEKKEFLSKVRGMEKFHVIFSKISKKPYVECDKETYDDEIFLYTDKQEAEKEVERLHAEQIQECNVVTVENKQFLQFFIELTTCGVNALIVTDQQEKISVQLSELITRPDTSNIEIGKKPLENPQLQLGLMYLMQMLRMNPPVQDQQKLAELGQEVDRNLAYGHFLMLVQDGPGEQNGKQVVSIRFKDGKMVVPLFTDGYELMKMKREPAHQVVMVNFAGLAKMELPDESIGFMINPGGVGFMLLKNMVGKMYDKYYEDITEDEQPQTEGE